MLKAKAALAAIALVGLCSGAAHAVDIDAKKIQLKTADPVKQQAQVQSKDPAVALPTGNNRPTANGAGAALHIYGANGLNFCKQLPAANWEDKGTQFKYKDGVAKDSGKIKAGQLQIKIKKGSHGMPPLLTKDPVTAILRSGSAGLNWCMNCTIGDLKKDVDGKFLVKDCTAATCTGEPGPPCTTPTTTTTTSTTTTTTSTTTTTLVLAFTTTAGTTSCGGAGLSPGPTAPFSGELDSDTAGTTKIADLGLGCLYIGGGGATAIPASLIPDGATNEFTVSGTTLSARAGAADRCTKGAGPGKHCADRDSSLACVNDGGCNGLGDACALDANCYFGPPLPIPNPAVTALSTCVLNVIQTDAGGTGDVTLGTSTVSIPLSSRVYVTGNVTAPCPRCIANQCDPTWINADGAASPDAGAPCTAVGSIGTTIQCRPKFGDPVDGMPTYFNGALPVTLNPLTTGPAVATSATGFFCMPQTSAGAFGKGTARRIRETGSPAGDLSDHNPHASILAATFCIPPTANGTINIVANLPGPGAIGLNGIAELLP